MQSGSSSNQKVAGSNPQLPQQHVEVLLVKRFEQSVAWKSTT